MEEIKSINREYRVQSAKEHSYKVTIPKKFYDIIGDISTLGIKIRKDGVNSTVDFHTVYDSSKLVERNIVSTNRTVRVPAAIGNGLKLRRDMINWKLLSDSDGHVLRLVTSYITLQLDTKNWVRVAEKDINPVKSGDKEHFELYISDDKIDWSSETNLSFIISENNGSICLRCQPTTEQNISKTSVTRIGDNKRFLRFYLPRSIIRSTGLLNKSVYLYKNKDSLAIVQKF